MMKLLRVLGWILVAPLLLVVWGVPLLLLIVADL